jgi:uncharacterized protein (UPF0276 family)
MLVALACNLDANILSAAFPLLEEGRVEAIEWSFDTLFGMEAVPAWFEELLAAYSQQHRLIGHGVYFSLLSGHWTPEQQRWLQHLSELAARFRFDQVTEHFGFFTGQNFHTGAPLPVPYSAATLRLGQDRLSRLAQACRCPVGLENLAFAYGLDEVKQHGEFLDKLLEPVNGFIILDLHNLYCQLHNFSVSYEALIALYPLQRVREIHISGGSWEDSVLVPNKKIRRDTHDEAVPEEVFALLERTLPLCPQLKYVVLEQLGTGLATAASQAQFRRDFARMEAVVTKHRAGRPAQPAESFMPLQPLVPGPVVTDETLSEQQRLLSRVLETAPSAAAAQLELSASPLAHTNWQVEKWEPQMLETAISIAQKWKQ